MTDLPQTAVHQCQCAQCRASRAIDVLRALPALTGDGRAALDTIEAALNELNENGFARWEAMNDVAVAAGLNWMDATQQDIVDAIKQARARAEGGNQQTVAPPGRRPHARPGDRVTTVNNSPLKREACPRRCRTGRQTATGVARHPRREAG